MCGLMNPLPQRRTASTRSSRHGRADARTEKHPRCPTAKCRAPESMAIFYPREAPLTSPRSELKVRERLAAVDRIIVFHSVAWQSRRGGKQSDGEADFVVLVPDLGILILEVKGGGIEVIEGAWFSTGWDGVRHAIKNPFEQAKDSKYALLAFLKGLDPALARYPIVHGVVFPDVSVDCLLGFSAPREIIIDRADLKHSAEAIEGVFRYWERHQAMSNRDIQRITEQLAPTIRVRRLLRDEIGDASKALVDLTTEQTAVLQAIRRIKRAIILGGAGTGKTILAIEKSSELASAGFRTLLLCYNAPLRRHLTTVLRDTSIEVETFHSLVHREARRAGVKPPFDPTSEWYETQAHQVLSASAAHNATCFDAILIDESQDFAPEWMSVVKSLVVDDGLVYLFADCHQDLYRRGWTSSNPLPELELTVNCRNTRPIAQRVAKIFDDRLDGKEVDGPEPRFVEAAHQQHLAPYVVSLVESIVLEDHIEPSQLIVLTDSGAVVSELRSTGAAGHLFTDLDGHGIPVETVHRFKGLERDVVVLALSDATVAEGISIIAYVGMSRASVALYVLASQKVKRAIGWDP